MRTFALCVVLTFALIAGSSSARAQQSLSFRDVTEKFARNMNALKELYFEKDIKESIKVVVEKSNDLVSLYSSGGAKAIREKLLKEKEELEKKPKLSQADMEKVSKLEKDIRMADSGGSFKKGRENLEQSISRLETDLKNLDTPDPEKTNLVALTLKHLAVYKAAIRMGD